MDYYPILDIQTGIDDSSGNGGDGEGSATARPGSVSDWESQIIELNVQKSKCGR